MSDWGWVSLTYGVVYSTLAIYTISLVRRRRRLGDGQGSP